MAMTQAQVAYQALRERLIAGRFEPGARIRYGPIGKELGISATPVREAIGLLASEGFVELVPQLGARVRSLTRAELVELYEVREALEPFAASKAAERASERQVQAVRTQYDRMMQIAEKVAASRGDLATKSDSAAFDKADLAFHMLVIASTGNQTLVRHAENSNALTKVFASDRHGYDSTLMQATCEDHEAILAAVASRDSEAAAEAMRRHVRKGLAVTLENIDARETVRWEES